MFNEPRTWKWAVPAFFAVLFFVTATLWNASGDAWQVSLSLYFFGMTALLGLVALVNCGKYVGDYLSSQLYTRRSAMALTADALILQNIKGVHPDTLRLVFGERQRIWMKHAGIELPEGVERHDVLFAAPDVTDLFVWFFLLNSNNYRCMAKVRLSDKSYRFDPLRKTTDYEMYDKLTALLKQRNIITEHFSNAAPLWIPPWTPGMLADDWGFEWDEERDGYHLENLGEEETDEQWNLDRLAE